ncbi:TetR/AcrR family transcriptional regulator [Nocardioides sambongensis]|uniref:TetR/AcrR family transcriptional regulator n=1 Tax=Nocardioides sambongensis TaxID=2589074 RepID=UPI00112CF0A3|nr:TetR/AcrR family transcriptional regulator [Nocardioides sambongensis]
MSPQAKESGTDSPQRPRVEGEREQEILSATLEILAEVGYDLLTMDRVAAAAKASKATLYRRWRGKPELVIEALLAHKGEQEIPDTGTLRGDLIASFCGAGGMTDPRQMAIVGSLITAISRDADFAEVFQRDFVGPKTARTLAIFQRARERGEIAEDVDLDIVIPALPGILLHRRFLLGEAPTDDLITQVVDQVILPAVTR